jgi:cellulose synthase/poly-beta-1,6-N-acetylglucosamine synthase-like glycosyltransferase
VTLLVEIVSWLAIVYFAALNLTYAALIVLSFVESGRHERRARYGGYDILFRSPFTPPVSVLVPAFNEEPTIVDSVRALRFIEYGEYEVIVIDDGSTDGTFTALRDAFDLEDQSAPIRRRLETETVTGVYVSRTWSGLRVLRKANGGKADALNAGINVARFPVFCAVDADAILEKDALLRVVKPFMEHPAETVAAAGIVRVLNGCRVSAGAVESVHAPCRFLPLVQSVEYLRAFLAGRTAWSRLGALFIISGAFGVFRKEAVVEAGGYRTDTVGEDMDLVLRLHQTMRWARRPYRMVFVPDPVVWTQVPERLHDLGRQRNRWQRGLLECLVHGKGMLGNPRYGVLGCLALPYNWLFEVLGPFVELAGYLAVIAGAATGILDLRYLGLFFLLAVGCGMALSISAILLEETRLHRYRSPGDVTRLLLAALAENLGYRQLTAVWRVWATVDYLRGAGGWGHIERRRLATDETGRGAIGGEAIHGQSPAASRTGATD